jgi:hypothetical protein
VVALELAAEGLALADEFDVVKVMRSSTSADRWPGGAGRGDRQYFAKLQYLFRP